MNRVDKERSDRPNVYMKLPAKGAPPTAGGKPISLGLAAPRLGPLRWVRQTGPPDTYLPGMPITRKPIEIPPKVAASSLRICRPITPSRTTFDATGSRSAHGLLEHMPAGTKLRLSEVKELFELMR